MNHRVEREGAEILPWTAPAYQRPPRHVVIDDEAEGWHWPSFAWGLWAGIYAGCMITVAAAWLWSFYL